MSVLPFNDPCWKPLEGTAALDGTLSDNGTSLTAETVGGTDWWRTTERDSRDGPTLGFTRKIGDGFEISVDLHVSPQTQAAIFLRVGPKQWLKAGLEYDNGKLWNAVVVCNPYSDWSLFPRSTSDSSRFTVVVRKNEVHLYLGDDMIREAKWFGPTVKSDAETGVADQDEAFVGIMACSPLKGGAEVAFKNFRVKEGVRGKA